MSITGVTTPDGTSAYAMKVAKVSQDQLKVDGQAAVALIEQSGPPPAEPGGPGSHINTYA